jgi:hypothetical protein
MTLQPSTASTGVNRVRIDACPAGWAREKPHLARRNEALTCSTPIPKVDACTKVSTWKTKREHVAEGMVSMEASRKPLAKVEGRKRMRLSGLTVVWRGTPSLDDWVAYIANGTKSKKLILADHSSERKVKGLLTRIQGMSKKEVEKLAKG